MAATSASRSWSTLARRSLAVTAAAAVALVAFAIPASAHKGTPEAKCMEDAGKTVLKIDLTSYNPNMPGDTTGKPNKIKVTDGATVLDEAGFADKYQKTWDDLSATEDHAFKVVVDAWDDQDPSDDKTFSFTWTKDVKACTEKEPEPEPEPEPSPPVEETTTTTTPPTTTTTEVPVGANANLAATGASIAIPLGIGGLLLVGGATMLLILRKRRKA